MGVGSKKVTTGYRYYLGMHLGLCAGPVDAVTRIDCGERTAWTGSVTSSSSITLDAEDLWGGEKREGGVAGTVDVAFGETTQAVNSYLSGKIGAPMSAFRGVLSLICRQVYIGTNPYVKPWSVEVKRLPDPTWNATKKDISGNANPAHMIRELITSPTWGMGLPSSLVDNTSFTAAANTLYSEGLGLSLVWTQQEPVSAFLQSILDHIGAVIYVDPATGLFVLKLIRQDYTPSACLLLDESNILRLESFSRRSLDETVNEIVVSYHDRATYTDTTVAAQDLGNIAAQGAVVSESRSYPGLPTATLASRVAERDVVAASALIAQVRLTVNREAYSLRPGDVFRLTWPPLGLSEVLFRVGEISGGTLEDGAIRLSAAQDVFGLPSATYLGVQAAGWADPVTAPAPCPQETLLEAPYWDVARKLSAADLDYLDTGVGFLQALGSRPAGSSYGYTVWSRLGSADYVEGQFSPHCPTATVAAVTQTQTTIPLIGAVDLDAVEEGSYAYLGPEVVKVEAISTSTETITVSRGVLDTVPQTHAAGTRVWFADGAYGGDEIEYTDGEVVKAKLLTLTGRGQLAIGSATERTVTMDSRFDRPYPPGNVKINGVAYPTSVSGDLLFTWSHRDRTQQTAYLVLQTEASIGPEAGTTYTLRLYGETDTLLRTETGLTGTSYTWTAEEADSGLSAGGDIYLINVVALLHFDGADASTTFTDERGHTFTPFGNAQIDTAQSKFGGTSGLFDGSGDYLISTSADYDLGTGDFTIEAWLYPTAASRIFIANNAAGWSTGAAGIGFGGYAPNIFAQGAGGQIAAGPALTASAWNHLAVVRSGTSFKVYTNGVGGTAGTWSGALNLNFNGGMRIGRNWDSAADWSGWIDELRITKGVARYTSNFTPPTEAFTTGVPRLNGRIRFELESLRDGLTSYQKHSIWVYRTLTLTVADTESVVAVDAVTLA